MATSTTNPDRAVTTPLTAGSVPPWPREQSSSAGSEHFPNTLPHDPNDPPQNKPSQSDALQALLAFAALHDQVRRRKALAARRNSFDAESLRALVAEFDPQEQFILDEVLQLVAERAVAITGADGLAIALAENNEIVLRAAAGDVRPDVGARIDRDSAFSGACFRSAQIVMCDDTETDPRVNLQACRKLGARSMVAVPLCGRRRVIGLLEAFSTWPFAFNDSDVRNLSLLAELVLGALKPEDEDRFAESAEVAATRLERALRQATAPAAIQPKPVVPVVPQTVPAPVAPVVDKKPIENKKLLAEVDPAPATAILKKPEIDKAPKLEAAKFEAPKLDAAVQTAPQLSLAAMQPAAANHRPVRLILLVAVVIGAAFAGGVWWKLKNSQLSSALIHTETMPARGASSGPTKPETGSPSAASAAENSTTTANASADTASDTTEPGNSDATPQELSKFPRVTGVRHWGSADSSTVVLDLQDQVQYEAHRLA